MSIKVIIAPTLEQALSLGSVQATVEAEYGNTVVEGYLFTLAHHVEKYRHCPAPCAQDLPSIEEGTILISHIDLDTIGGVLALMGIKPKHDPFWNAAAFIDTNGPHHMYQVDKHIAEMLHAFYAYNNDNRLPRYTEITDVTDIFLNIAPVIEKIIFGDIDLINRGKEWIKETEAAVEAALISENSKVRAFVTDGVFCSSSYYSKFLGMVVPYTVSFNTKFNAITVSCADGSLNCRDFVQSVWGMDAGGHAGIAGSPRGRNMTMEEFHHVVSVLSA